MNDQAQAIGFVILCALSLPLTMALAYILYDRWMHDGVTVFTRRRVRRSGIAAPARVLSSEMLNKTIGGSGTFATPLSIVYEVLPPGAPAFRARGVEVMALGEEDANLPAGPNATVQVRFDPASLVVVLERVDFKKWQREREAASREAQESLLRGRPRG